MKRSQISSLCRSKRAAVPRASGAFLFSGAASSALVFRELRLPMRDTFNLDRFVRAQDDVYDTVLRELKDGHKRSHWIWFIFPQVAGLGRSPMAEKYAIQSRLEADAYSAHPVLGARLRECTSLVDGCNSSTISDILPSPDDLKFHSSMTLFARVTGDELYERVLNRYLSGHRDIATEEFLDRH